MGLPLESPVGFQIPLRLPMESQWESQGDFNWNSMGITLESQWSSNGNPKGQRMDANVVPMGPPLEFPLGFPWDPDGGSNGNSRGFPRDPHVGPT